jgi:hypothetical protein
MPTSTSMSISQFLALQVSGFQGDPVDPVDLVDLGDLGDLGDLVE